MSGMTYYDNWLNAKPYAPLPTHGFTMWEWPATSRPLVAEDALAAFHAAIDSGFVSDPETAAQGVVEWVRAGEPRPESEYPFISYGDLQAMIEAARDLRRAETEAGINPFAGGGPEYREWKAP